jgi:hypothetical protein
MKQCWGKGAGKHLCFHGFKGFYGLKILCAEVEGMGDELTMLFSRRFILPVT